MKGIEITASAMTLADGLFSSNNRYPRKVADLADLALWMTKAQAVSADIVLPATSTSSAYCRWRWECGPATMPASLTTPIATAPGFAVDQAIGV